MKLSNISIGNLKRRKGKALVLIAGLSMGVAMVVALIGITTNMQADVEKKLDEYGANIIVAPKTETLSLSYGGVIITNASYDVEELSEGDAQLINTIENKKNISAIAPKVMGTQTINELSYLIVGVDFPSEFLIKKWWRLYGERADAKGETVLGSSVAKNLKLKPGDTFMIGKNEFHITGVLEENTSQDDVSIFMDIQEARILLGKEGKTSMIEVSALCSDCPIEDIVSQISAKLPHAKVSPVRQAMTLKMQTVEQVVRFSIAVSIVVLLIGAFIVFISMLSSVNERTKEIGVLRAIGYRKFHIVKIILLEALIVSMLAGLLGWVGGSLSASVLVPDDMLIGSFGLQPFTMALAVVVSIAIGMISSIYPAIKASNLEPLEALRYI